jgi:arginyl-tRNA synthetase
MTISSKMEIQFWPKSLSLPYAAVATNLATKRPHLQLTPTTKAQTHLALVTPDGSIQGESHVLRFLARASAPHEQALSSCPLYLETHPELVVSIDGWLDEVRRAIDAGMTPKDILALARAVNDKAKPHLSSQQLSIADFAVWGAIRGHDRLRTSVPGLGDFPNFMAWFKRMEALPECKQAADIVDKLLDQVQPASGQTEAPNSSAGIDPSLIKNGIILDVFRQHIGEELAKVIPQFDAPTLASFLEIPKSKVQFAADFSFAVPRLRIKGNPTQVGQDLASKMKPTALIREITVGGPFLNFHINMEALRDALVPMVLEMREKWGTNTLGAGKNVIVEFSSPNIAKPFHAGHLRSTIIGNFVRNICKAHGMNTTAINYLGDWGKQYGLLAVGFEMFGSEEELQKDPIHHLFQIYVRINNEMKERPELEDQARAYFKKMEDGDKKALALWQRFRDLSIEKYKQIYKRLNVEFDVYSGESQFAEGMVRSLDRLKKLNLLTESQGALIVDLEKYKLTPALVQKADGATLYITRDIAAAWERHEKYKFDEMYYVVAAAQGLHFQQLFKILELAEFDWYSKCHHINFGMVNGMSTRKGTVVFLEDILNEAQTTMHEVMQKNEKVYAQIENPMETADTIGLSAVIVQDFGAKRIKDYEFNWERMTSFQGDTGPFLQYAHTRLCSIERKYLESIGKPYNSSVLPPVPFSTSMLKHLTEPKALELLMTVAQYPELIASIPSRQFEPINLVVYLMALSHQVSSALDELYVMGREKELAEARFWLYYTVRITVGNGMRLLGLKPLERM